MSDVTMTIKVDAKKWEEMSAPGAVEAKADRIVGKWAFVIEGAAKQNAPVLTGFLKNSIQAAQERPAFWSVTDGAEYGLFQELGTKHMVGKFFLTKACEANADKFFDEMVKVFG